MKGLSECGNCGNQFSIRDLFFEWQIIGLAYFFAFSNQPTRDTPQGARPPNKRVPNLTLDFSRVWPSSIPVANEGFKDSPPKNESWWSLASWEGVRKCFFLPPVGGFE